MDKRTELAYDVFMHAQGNKGLLVTSFDHSSLLNHCYSSTLHTSTTNIDSSAVATEVPSSSITQDHDRPSNMQMVIFNAAASQLQTPVMPSSSTSAPPLPSLT